MSEMLNTGQMPRIRIGNSARRPSANLTGGPLHRLTQLQMLAYNTDLYRNFSSASRSPHGIAGISVLVDSVLEALAEKLHRQFKSEGQRVELADLEPWQLLPYTRDLVTYEGSMTAPGCHETVTWIILNQPIHITKDHMAEWGKMVQTTQKSEEPQFLAPNRRAVQEFNSRLEKKECKMAIPKVMYKSVNGPPPPSVTTNKHRLRHAHSQKTHDEDFL
ncbi:carbonate dehydratase, eukaryotic-type [Ostertagia ostertagi]